MVGFAVRLFCEPALDLRRVGFGHILIIFFFGGRDVSIVIEREGRAGCHCGSADGELKSQLPSLVSFWWAVQILDVGVSFLSSAARGF